VETVAVVKLLSDIYLPRASGPNVIDNAGESVPIRVSVAEQSSVDQLLLVRLCSYFGIGSCAVEKQQPRLERQGSRRNRKRPGTIETALLRDSLSCSARSVYAFQTVASSSRSLPASPPYFLFTPV
jgi:hypothetical protein